LSLQSHFPSSPDCTVRARLLPNPAQSAIPDPGPDTEILNPDPARDPGRGTSASATAGRCNRRRSRCGRGSPTMWRTRSRRSCPGPVPTAWPRVASGFSCRRARRGCHRPTTLSHSFHAPSVRAITGMCSSLLLSSCASGASSGASDLCILSAPLPALRQGGCRSLTKLSMQCAGSRRMLAPSRR